MQGQSARVRIRPALVEDAAGIARVHVRSWQGAYRGILPDSFLDSLDLPPREERWRQNLQSPAEDRFTFVAELPSPETGLPAEIAGFASGGPERDGLIVDGVAYDGEVYALYLAPEHQRQGNGHRLVAAAAERLLEQGAKSIVIWALQDNGPARAFYEALGGVLLGEKSIKIADTYDLVDVAYGWPDAQTLLDRARGAGARSAE